MSRIAVGSALASALVLTSARSARAEGSSAPPSVVGAPPPTSPESRAGYNLPVSDDRPGGPTARDNQALGADGHPLAGYHNGLFYLRDAHDSFHLYIQGRSQIDFYSFFGRGVSDTTLKPTLFLRRIRPEVTGELLGHWRFMIAGDFGATAIDNPRATNETSAAAPGTAPTATSARFASAETTRFQAAATDVFINYRRDGIFNVLVGQTDAPLTMENRTSDKFLPFMERSLAVRAVGVPTNKELGLMAWGETARRQAYYALGVFNGDGQNRPNVDSRFDVIGRVFVHPLAIAPVRDNTLQDAQIGISARYGSRDRKWVDYDYPAMTTQGSYAFWSPVYTSSKGATHVLPAGDQLTLAAELRVPYRRFDLTSEIVYVDNGTREGVDGFQASTSERFGAMRGFSYYAMLGFWAFGDRDVNGVPGYGNPPRLDWSRADLAVPRQALQLLVRWEQVRLDYESASRSGVADARNIDGRIRVNALSFGANYWATRHVRLTLDYVHDVFPSSGPSSAQTSTNRAQAPGNGLSAGVDDSARSSAHDLHELLARIAVAL
ncbi:MAG: hypothetical protein JWP97_5617 [Labilithrix sp.]|nr:hypothetical protein [Labilithrix sp.]